jgi:hypothetical protein
MSGQSQSSRFRVLFESALLDYQNQTGTTLVAGQLQNCDSVESVTAVLQEQARAFTEFRGGDDRIMKSLKSVVSVLYAFSASSALGEAMVGLVRWKASRNILHLMIYSAAHPTCKGDIRWLRHPSLCMILVYFRHVHGCNVQAHQAVKDIGTSYEALVELLESIEHLMNHLDIYTRVPSTGPMTEIIVKIMVELLSTLALVTKQINQNRPSKCVLPHMAICLNGMQ